MYLVCRHERATDDPDPGASCVAGTPDAWSGDLTRAKKRAVLSVFVHNGLISDAVPVASSTPSRATYAAAVYRQQHHVLGALHLLPTFFFRNMLM